MMNVLAKHCRDSCRTHLLPVHWQLFSAASVKPLAAVMLSSDQWQVDNYHGNEWMSFLPPPLIAKEGTFSQRPCRLSRCQFPLSACSHCVSFMCYMNDYFCNLSLTLSDPRD